MSLEYSEHYSRQPVVTKWLLILNIGVFITCLLTVAEGQNLTSSPLFAIGALSGLEFAEGEDLWTVFTYMFLHAGVLHIVCNMVGLWFLGRVLEDNLGWKHLLGIYLLGGLLGAGLWLAFNWGGGVLVGASASVLALVVAFATLYPRERVWLFPIPVPIEARWIAIGYLGLTVILALSSINDGGNAGRIAHLAHLGGMVAGFVYSCYLKNCENKFSPFITDFLEDDLQKSESYSEFTDHDPERITETKDYVMQAVDPVLDKVKLVGYHNLTESEKKILQKAQQILDKT